MINLFVFINDKETDLKKTLLSILLQSIVDKIRVFVVYKNEDLKVYFDDVVSLFLNKLVIKNLILFDSDIFKKIYSDSEYLMIMKDNEFFYDAFSIESLQKIFVENSDYDFVYSNLVTINDNNIYETVTDYYSNISGKLFNLNFLRQNNLNLFESLGAEFICMSKCFLFSENNYFVDSIAMVVEKEKYTILDAINKYVVDIISVYNELVGQVEEQKIKRYIGWSFGYLIDLYVKCIGFVSLSDFSKVVCPLESLYRDLFNEV